MQSRATKASNYRNKNVLQRLLAQTDRGGLPADHRHRLVRAAADHREAERDPHDE